MGVNRGKQFEEQIKAGFITVPDLVIERLPDPQNGYAGVRNICDFFVYSFPFLMFLECKSCYGHRLPFSNITENQWNGLLEKSKYSGVVAGYMVWFIDHDITVFIPATVLKKMKDNGAKSIRFDDPIISSDCIKVAGKKKRVFFDYDMVSFLQSLKVFLVHPEPFNVLTPEERRYYEQT